MTQSYCLASSLVNKTILDRLGPNYTSLKDNPCKSAFIYPISNI